MRIGQIAIDITPLREGKDFRLLFTGRFISMAGNMVATTAANWQVYGLTHSSLAVGLLTLANSVGMFTGLLVGGMLADQHDRRMLMVTNCGPSTRSCSRSAHCQESAPPPPPPRFPLSSRPPRSPPLPHSTRWAASLGSLAGPRSPGC
jgi:hypothetical protein